MALRSRFFKFSNKIKTGIAEIFGRPSSNLGKIAPLDSDSIADKMPSGAAKPSVGGAPQIGELPFETDPGFASNIFNLKTLPVNEDASSIGSASLAKV